MKKLILPFLLLLTSCISMSEPPLPPALSFKRLAPIYMSVSGIEVVEDYKSPMRAPNVEHLMPYAPADAMQIWVKDRLKAAGGERTMQVIIKDASVVEKNTGEKGWFDAVSSKEYSARLEVEMRVYGSGALSEGNINVVATREITLGPRLTAKSRDEAFYGMITQMMNVMNVELEKNIYQHLGNFVNFSMTP